MDLKRLNKLKQKNLPKAIEDISKVNDSEALQFNTQMLLPEPVISDLELQSISKFAKNQNDQSMSMKDNQATAYLIGDYS
jgi:hypothetical protein